MSEPHNCSFIGVLTTYTYFISLHIYKYELLKKFKPDYNNVNMVVKLGDFEECDSLQVLKHIMAQLLVVIDWTVIL